jgi:hypothetical protein
MQLLPHMQVSLSCLGTKLVIKLGHIMYPALGSDMCPGTGQCGAEVVEAPTLASGKRKGMIILDTTEAYGQGITEYQGGDVSTKVCICIMQSSSTTFHVRSEFVFASIGSLVALCEARGPAAVQKHPSLLGVVRISCNGIRHTRVALDLTPEHTSNGMLTVGS